MRCLLIKQKLYVQQNGNLTVNLLIVITERNPTSLIVALKLVVFVYMYVFVAYLIHSKHHLSNNINLYF